MPVFRSGKGRTPAWCEMEYFDIAEVGKGQSHTFQRVGQKEKVIVGRGACKIRFGDQTVNAEEGTNLDLPIPNGQFEVSDVTEDTTVIRMAGRWGEELGGSGLFGVVKTESPKFKGDPVDYEKETTFDRHFHDCDEYWIVFEGSGLAMSEGEFHELKPGDCLATGMGHHHDFPKVKEPVRAVFFETTMEGRKRRRHLWEHTDGPAEPRMERV